MLRGQPWLQLQFKFTILYLINSLPLPYLAALSGVADLLVATGAGAPGSALIAAANLIYNIVLNNPFTPPTLGCLIWCSWPTSSQGSSCSRVGLDCSCNLKFSILYLIISLPIPLLAAISGVADLLVATGAGAPGSALIQLHFKYTILYLIIPLPLPLLAALSGVADLLEATGAGAPGSALIAPAILIYHIIPNNPFTPPTLGCLIWCSWGTRSHRSRCSRVGLDCTCNFNLPYYT